MENRADEVANLMMDVYELHERVIAKSGGIAGLREASMLHSAVARPFASFGGWELYPTDFDKAAALFHSLVKSHPFMDGTKRTAFISAMFFLESCGYIIPPEPPLDEVIEFCVSLAEENLRQSRGEIVAPLTIPEIAAWFRRLLGVSESADDDGDNDAKTDDQ